MKSQLVTALLLLTFSLEIVFSTDPVGVLILEGRHVRLNATYPGDSTKIEFVRWNNNTNQRVVSYTPATQDLTITPTYQNRVMFSTEDYSLTLKNPQMKDSGLYTALIMEDSTKTYKYNLKVIEQAAVPKLTVVSNDPSPDLCNITLSCTAPSVALTFNCLRTNSSTVCYPEDQDRFLSIFSNQSAVSCNHSNPVSWSLDSIELQPLCKAPAPPPSPLHSSTPGWLIGIIAVAGISALCLLGGIYWLKCKNKDQGEQVQSGAPAPDTTVYSTVQFPRNSSAILERAQASAPSTTVYDTVQSQGTSDSGAPAADTTEYCTVQSPQSSSAILEGTPVPAPSTTVYATVKSKGTSAVSYNSLL